MKQALFLGVGIVLGALGSSLLGEARAAESDTYTFNVISIRAGSGDSGVEGALKSAGESGYFVGGVLGNQVILQRKR